MKAQFIGIGRPQITLRGAGFGSPPEFEPGSTHTARCALFNPTDSVWAYRGEVYLDGRIAASGVVEFTIAAKAKRTIDFPIVMPAAGKYQAFLDVAVGEELVLHHPFAELVEIAAPPPAREVPAITGARITKVEEVEDGRPGPGNDLHVTVGVTLNNTGALISSDYPDDASIEVWILNPACPAMEAEPLFFTRFGNRDIPAGVNTLNVTLGMEIVYLTGYRTTPIRPGATPVILRIKLVIFGWAGNPSREAEFSGTLVW